MTANERYLDSQLRHEVGVRRYTAGQVLLILELLENLDRQTVRRLRRKLSRAVNNRRGVQSAALASLLEEVIVLRRKGIRSAFSGFTSEMREFAKTEVELEGRLVRAAIPIEIALATPEAQRLADIVTSEPFRGAVLRDWTTSLVRADRDRLERVVKLGIAEGLGVDDIVRSVVGTRSAGFSDGVLSTSRAQATALVRTTINHVANGSRELFYKENEEYYVALRWEATLDGRTSAICRGRDGALTPVGDNALPAGSHVLDPPGARPPAHFNCRSTMIAVFDNDAEIFAGLDRQSEVGPVPQETTYDEWLRRQPRDFQDNVLGKKKAALFRGGMTLDRFVDRRGNELTLEQLRRTRPEAFEEAGIS